MSTTVIRRDRYVEQLKARMHNGLVKVITGIRQDGVNDHVRAILAKIGAANHTEAVAIALRKHLLKI